MKSDTYYIESSHTTYESSYEEGQLNQITEYEMKGEVQADSIDEAIETYFEEVLYFNYNKQFAHIEDDVLSYSVLVDEDQDEVTIGSRQYQLWTLGQAKLFDNDIQIQLMKKKWEKLDEDNR